MSLRRSFAAAAVAAVTLSLASAALASPWGLKPGEFYSELSGSFFSTEDYFRNSDDGVRLALGGRFEQRVVRSHNEFGWKKTTSVWIDVPFVSRTFALDAGGSRTSTGLGDLEFGFRRAMHVGKSPIALELAWTAPLGTNRALFPGTSGSGGLDGRTLVTQASGPVRDTSTFFCQGLQGLSASLELGGSAGSRAWWTLGGGYRTRFHSIVARGDDDRYADWATGTASLGIWIGPSLLVSGELRGEWPMSQGGPYDRVLTPVSGANGPELEAVSMLAGPRFTYRVDDRMDVFAGSWHTPRGRNVLHHDQYFCGIAWKHTGLDRLAGALGGTKAH